jgi:hypothetical protein
MIMEKQMECRLPGETEVLGENLSRRHFCPSQNPIWPDPGLNPDRCGGKPETNRLSYGAATRIIVTTVSTKLNHTGPSIRPNPSGRTGPGVDSASNRNEYQESLKIKKRGGKVRPVRRADNLAAI